MENGINKLEDFLTKNFGNINYDDLPNKQLYHYIVGEEDPENCFDIFNCKELYSQYSNHDLCYISIDVNLCDIHTYLMYKGELIAKSSNNKSLEITNMELAKDLCENFTVLKFDDSILISFVEAEDEEEELSIIAQLGKSVCIDSAFKQYSTQKRGHKK